MDDFSKLQLTEHMFKWLADEPYAAIRLQMERAFQQQVPGSQLSALRATSEPQWLTGARRNEDTLKR